MLILNLELRDLINMLDILRGKKILVVFYFYIRKGIYFKGKRFINYVF